MSSGLSGSCGSAYMLAQDFGGKVQVVDNQRISVTQRQSVLDARELAKTGKNAEEIKDILIDDKFNSSIYIMLDTLYYLKKGGRITPAAAAIRQSTTKPISNSTGKISADTPITNRILKILLPTILPIAISAFPLRAAITDVNNSGKEVPNATIVRPINFSLNPIFSAIPVAESTVTSLPKIINAKPTMQAIIIFHTGFCEESTSSDCISPFFIITNIYSI